MQWHRSHAYANHICCMSRIGRSFNPLDQSASSVWCIDDLLITADSSGHNQLCVASDAGNDKSHSYSKSPVVGRSFIHYLTNQHLSVRQQVSAADLNGTLRRVWIGTCLARVESSKATTLPGWNIAQHVYQLDVYAIIHDHIRSCFDTMIMRRELFVTFLETVQHSKQLLCVTTSSGSTTEGQWPMHVGQQRSAPVCSDIQK